MPRAGVVRYSIALDIAVMRHAPGAKKSYAVQFAAYFNLPEQ